MRTRPESLKDYAAVVFMACMIAGFAGGADPVYLSPIALALAPGGDSIYVAEETANQIAVYDLKKRRVAKVFPLPGPPTSLAATGDYLLVTVGNPEGILARINVKSGKMDTEDVGHTPTGIAITADGKTTFVCNRFNNNISIVDTERLKEKDRLKAVREPVAATLADNGTKLFVTNHLPAGAADGAYAAAAISVYDVEKRKPVTTINLPNGSTGLRGICASPDGAFVYVTHILARYQLPTTQLERGWMNTNALTIIDAKQAKAVNTVLLDDVDLGGANPWGLACSPDGTSLCVAHAGTHEVSVIDRKALHEKLNQVAEGKKVTQVSDSPEDVPNDLSFLVGIRQRKKLAGNGPRGLVVADGVAYAAEYFTDSIGTVKLDAEAYHRKESLPLGPKQEMTTTRRGEMLFNNAEMCFQHWQSCASCHPDARADGLNWDLLNDGMGNPKQTKSLLLSHRTPPVMVTGVRPDAETAVRAGMTYIQFTVRPEEDAKAIDDYLKMLQPVPSPHLENGTLSRAARKGQDVFEKAGCAACHPAPLYTDLKSYDVGLGLNREKGISFDTPTLIENWRTAPFLYDGRAATMMDVLTTHNPDDSHGKTAGLSKKDLANLTEFILSH